MILENASKKNPKKCFECSVPGTVVPEKFYEYHVVLRHYLVPALVSSIFRTRRVDIGH
jgi:hypothetical protein